MLACLNYVHQAHMLPFQLCRLKNEVRVRRLLPAHYLSGSCNSARFQLPGCQVNLHIQRFSQRWECSAGMGMLKGWVLAQGKPCGLGTRWGYCWWWCSVSTDVKLRKAPQVFWPPRVVLTAWLLGEEVWEPWGLGNNYGDQESFYLPSPFLLSLLSGKKLTDKNSFKIVQ